MDTPRDNAPLLDDRIAGSALLDDATELQAEAARVSSRTNIHDAGSDANDTPDGLSEQEEAVRHAAEDIPTGQDPAGSTESVPVFDRGSLPPKV